MQVVGLPDNGVTCISGFLGAFLILKAGTLCAFPSDGTAAFVRCRSRFDVNGVPMVPVAAFVVPQDIK